MIIKKAILFIFLALTYCMPSVDLSKSNIRQGPGMFGKGNPDEYHTILGYPVKKKIQ